MKPLLDLLKAGGGVVTAPDAVQNKAVSFDISRGRWVGSAGLILRLGPLQLQYSQVH